MKRNEREKPHVLILWVCLLVFSSLLPLKPAFAITIEEERDLGRKFMAQIQTQFELIEDDFAKKFINDLGTYLIAPLETRYFPFRFYLIRNNNLNAFAAPGGHVFVFSGLVEALDRVDELASVICHEIGHVSARHLSQRIEMSKKIGLATMAGVLAGALLGGELAGALTAGSLAAGLQAQLHYSREDERQADQLGFKYMQASGFDPSGMIDVLKKIEKEQLYGSNKIPAYLLTHPTGPERMANLDSLLSRYAPVEIREKVSLFRTDFPLFRTILRAVTLEPSVAEKRFHQDLKDHPEDTLPHFGLGMVYKARSEFNQALHHLKEALAAEPDSVPMLKMLAETFQMKGEDQKAIVTLEKALKIDDTDKHTLFLLGVSHENLEQYEKAISLFKRLAALKPVGNDVYYHLGLSLGRLNRLPLAHYNFGIFFKNKHQHEKARFHFRKAEGLAGNDAALKEKIRKEATDLPPRKGKHLNE